ncbi:hypothetical protein Q7P35_002100 [Cladosporium inversicolor]
MVTFSAMPPMARYPPPSLQQGGGPADIILQCGDHTFEAHRSIVCRQSQKLRDACDAASKVGTPRFRIHTREADESEQQDATVMMREDVHDAPTTKRMLDFFYHGEYDVGAIGDDDGREIMADVVSHLLCYAIAEDYQVQELSTQALSNFSECISAVSPDDFAKLMGNTANCIGAKPVHDALRNAATARQDELAACKTFTKTLGCEHITVPATLDADQARDLKAAKQLAVHGANLFRIANRSTIVANIEKTKLVKAYQEALQKNQQLRSQADRDSSTLILDERVHNDAKDEPLALEAAAKQAKDELAVSEERATRMAQAMQKMKLDLEVLRNAEHNNKLALEKANKEAAVPRLALEEHLEHSNAEMADLRATLQASLDANRRHVTNEQRMTAEIQRLTKSHEQTAAELVKVKVQRDNAVTNSQGASRGTKGVKDELFASQKNLARVTQERDEAEMNLEKAKQDHDCTSASLFRVTRELAQAQQERDQARVERDQAITQQGTTAQTLEQVNQEFASRFNQVVAENIALGKAKKELEQAKEDQKRTGSKLEKADQESARLRSQRDEVRAEITNLRTQARDVHTAMSEGARMLRVSNQQNDVVSQEAAETASLRAEVNQVRLQNFTLQRSIFDLQFLILSNAENKQQLLEYGGSNFPAQ